MKPTMTIDAREWKIAAQALHRHSSRTLVDFTNGQAMKVVVEAIKNTKKAGKADLEFRLGSTGRKLRDMVPRKGKRAGLITKARDGFRFDNGVNNTLAARILGKRFQKTGEWGVKGRTMEDRVANFINARLRSIGFITSGWIPALRKLNGVVRKKPPKTRMTSSRGVKQWGKDRGWAKPARFSLRRHIFVDIVNKALLENEGTATSKGGNPMPIVTKGAKKAMRIATVDMRAELHRRLNPVLKRFSAKRGR